MYMVPETVDERDKQYVDQQREHWNERYTRTPWLFGIEPHPFTVLSSQHLPPDSHVLLIGDGEGRNGVWMAEQGHRVTTIDLSPVAVEHSRELAAAKGVVINALVGDLADEIKYLAQPERWDAVVSIFVHLPDEAIRRDIARHLTQGLKRSGRLVLVASSLVTDLQTVKDEWSGLNFPLTPEVEEDAYFWVEAQK